MTKRSHQGLVQRDVTVKRGGKTFTQKRWVKAGEDEPEERKGKKEEVKGDFKGKESYKIGEQFNFLGDKYMKVEKVSESERTVKLSNGLVYTFEAIEAGKKGISGGKYNIGDKVTYNDKEHTITYINQITGLVELDNMGSISEKDLNPKEKTIKDLKPKPKKEDKKEVKIKPKKEDKKEVKTKLAKNESILLKDLVKSEKEAKKFVEDHGWVWDKESNVFPDMGYYDNLRSPTRIYTNDEGKIYGMVQYSENKYKNQLNGRIELLEINTSMRGKGHGKQMMKDVVKDMAKCDNITLDSLNENSDKFYDAIGMKIGAIEGEQILEPEGHFVGNKNWINKILGEKSKSKSTGGKLNKSMTPDNIESTTLLNDMNIEGGINEDYTSIINFSGGAKGIYKTSSAIDTQGEENFKKIESILGWDNSPELAIGDFGRGEGSCQGWVSDSVDIATVKIGDKHYDDLAKIYLMDIIVGNYDRHSDNIKPDKKGKFWAIDNDTWGSKITTDLNISNENMGKQGDWMMMNNDERIKFQAAIDKNAESVIKHKDKITKYITNLSKKANIDKDFKEKYRGWDMSGSDKPQNIKTATDNMLFNILKISKHKIGV